jgi:RHS repeat-associated protein
VNGWVWSNETTHRRFYDRDGRVTAIAVPPEVADQQRFAYDLLDRLVSATLVRSAVDLAYAYDATGNRVQEMRNGAVSLYTVAGTSNRLQAISGATTRSMSYNTTGSLSSDRDIEFGYDGRERMVTAGSTSYYVSGLDQRIEKAGPGANTPSGVRQFLYDEQGHLLGEYDGGNGVPIAEHVYLGDWPVGLIQGNTVYYVHPDQLGAPRIVTRATDNQTMWAWQREPFGAGIVQAVGGFEYNLRFPGQYYDAETGLHYNYFRDYDPSVGRYVESDPVGLKGGTNTFLYVAANPFKLFDSFGLDGEGFSTRYGNWCGKRWSGGREGPTIPKEPAGPIDSVDDCCETHDYCYAKWECNECPPPPGAEEEKNHCDRDFVKCLDALKGKPPQTWPRPPRRGTEETAYFFCQKAKRYFQFKLGI